MMVRPKVRASFSNEERSYVVFVCSHGIAHHLLGSSLPPRFLPFPFFYPHDEPVIPVAALLISSQELRIVLNERQVLLCVSTRDFRVGSGNDPFDGFDDGTGNIDG